MYSTVVYKFVNPTPLPYVSARPRLKFLKLQPKRPVNSASSMLQETWQKTLCITLDRWRNGHGQVFLFGALKKRLFVMRSV